MTESGNTYSTTDAETQTQTQNILFNNNNRICTYKMKTETPLGLFAFYSWKIFIYVMQDLWELYSGG